MTEIALRTPSALTPAAIDFTDKQIDVIKNTIAKGASDVELDLFLAICRRTGLDPFLKQIHLIPRRSNVDGKWVTSFQPMVGIDGMRLVADRTGRYAGPDPVEWLDSEGTWSEVWTGKGTHPVAARYSVYRKDWNRKATAVVRWDEYAQDTTTWKKMPSVMLAKCAESLALRRAFPAEMAQLGSAMSMDFDTKAFEAELEQTTYVAAPVEPPPARQQAPRPSPAPVRAPLESTPRTGAAAAVIQQMAPADEKAAPPAGWTPKTAIGYKQATLVKPDPDCDHEWMYDGDGRMLCSKCKAVKE